MSRPDPEPSAAGGHSGQPVVRAGAALDEASAAVVLVHGRGASAESILALVPRLGHRHIAYLAPQARGGTWYPFGFMAPVGTNEPDLSSALAVLSNLLEMTAAAGIAPKSTVLMGFSQGACLSLEFAARNARIYGGIVGFTGGLIGPAGTPRNYEGSFDGTPAFLGSSIPDPHVPWERVEETGRMLQRMGAVVDVRGYPGMPHTINAEEIRAARAILDRVSAAAGGHAPRSRP